MLRPLAAAPPLTAKLYQKAEQAFREKEYGKSLHFLNQILDADDFSPLKGKALFLKGKVYTFLEESAKSFRIFRDYFENYPDLWKDPDLPYWLGVNAYLQDNEKAARYLNLQESGKDTGYYGKEALFYLALLKIKSEDYGDALDILDDYIRSSENPDKGLFYKGLLFYRLGDFPSATESLSTILLNYPESSYKKDALLVLGNADYQEQKYADADRRFAAFLEYYPDDPRKEEALYRSALLNYLYLGNGDKAKELLKTLLKSFPETPHKQTASRFLADLAVLDKDWKTAEKLYRSLLESSTEERVPLLYNLAYVLLRKGDFRKAESLFRRVEQSAPPELRNKAAYGLFLANQADNNPSEAAAVLADLFYKEDSPKKREKIARELILYYKEKNLDIYPLLRELVEQLPFSVDTPKYLFILGEYNEKKGNIAQAFRYYQQIREDYKKSNLRDESLYRIAYMYAGRREIRRAVPPLKEIVDGSDSPEYVARALYSLGILMLNIQNPAEAEVYFRDLTDRYPQSVYSARAYRFLAESNESRERYVEALRNYRRARDLSSDENFQAEVSLKIADIFYKMKEYDRAAEAFSNISVDYPTSPFAGEAEYKAGLSAENLLRWDQSLLHFNRVLSLSEPPAENPSMTPPEKETSSDSEKTDPLREKALYHVALNLFKLKENDAAFLTLQTLTDTFPNSTLPEKAVYRLGEEAFLKKRYPEAVKLFGMVVQNKKSSPSLARSAQIRRGFAYIENQDRGKGIQDLLNYLRFYPKSGQAPTAAQKLATLLSSNISPEQASKIDQGVRKIGLSLPLPLRAELLVPYLENFGFPETFDKKDLNELYDIYKGDIPQNLKTRTALLIVKRHTDQGETDQAGTFLKALIPTLAEKKSQGKALFLLAEIYKRKGENKKAARTFFRTGRYYGEFRETASEALYESFILYTAVGDIGRAEDAKDLLLKNYQDSLWAQKIESN